MLAPETIKRACERHISDLKRDDLVYDAESADAAIDNIELFVHPKGALQGQNIHLEPWECFAVAMIFGWKWKKNGLRRFRRAYFRIPRKNGKSLLAISIALLMFSADGEPGAEVYLGATGQEQAKDILFRPAKFITEKADGFIDAYGIEVNASSLVIPENFSRLQAVIKKPDDGTNPHCAVVDEYHLHDTDDQYAVFDTGMGAREQPLLLVTTTAGSNLSGPCKEMDDECVSMLQGGFNDDSLFALIYAMDEGDDWQDPLVLKKVNPNYGVSVSADYLLDQLEIAKRSAAKQNEFRTKHLNEWVGAAAGWMNILHWQKQAKPLSINDFRGASCHIAVDLAVKLDANAVAVVFRDGDEYHAFLRFYAPEMAINENDRYRIYRTSGELIETPGNMTDYAQIEHDIRAICEAHDVQSVAFDPYQSNYISNNLQDSGIPVVTFGQTLQNMSDPMKELEALIVSRRMWHDGNQMMTWMVGNVVVKPTADGNIKPLKATRNDPLCKIDGVVALIMALGRWMEEGEPVNIDDWLKSTKAPT